MDDNIHIAFLGDLMPGGVLHDIDNFVSEDVGELLSEFDIRV